MPSISSRARWGLAVAVAFIGGLLFASSMDWTRLGFAHGMPSASDVAPMIDASNAFVAIADHATPAVVSIQVDTRTRSTRTRGMQIPPGMIPPGMEQYFGAPQQQQPAVQEASGSGFIVTKDGYILTNNHVVTGMDHATVADKIQVKLMDGRVFTAKVIGHDPTTDVAVLKIDGNDFPTIPLGDDAKARVGEWVLAIGNPLGVLDFTVTAGIISAKGRSLPGLLGNDRYAISDLLQTDAAINPGNSGGPLVNTRGEVIGINNAIASPTGYNAGYGFAVPITLAKKVMDDIIAHGHVRVGILGVVIGPVDADAAAVAGLKTVAGVAIQGFNPDTPDNPARRAGVQAGDIIVAADGQPTDRQSALQRVVRNHAPGETVKLDVMRYGKKMSFDVKLAEMPAPPAQAVATPINMNRGGGVSTGPKLGVTLTALPPDGQRPPGMPSRGVLVTDVVGLSPAYSKLGGGDVITDVLYPAPARAINSPAELQ
ncbi:MAG: S1C family serine protease, partial [Gemmatimonadaceae bacterium]